jgi:hemolysin activation/secretion protein
MWGTRISATLAAWLLATCPAAAQVGGLERATPGETRPGLPDFLPDNPPASITSPASVAPPATLSSGLRFVLSQVRFQGGNLLSPEQLGTAAAPYVGRTLGAEDLIRLRNDVTRLYLEAGYLTSGAVIPDQVIRDGVLTVTLVEGTLSEITVSGLDYLDPSFVAGRLRRGVADPFNVRDLQESLLLLLADVPVARLDAALGPGEAPGQGRLTVTAEEQPRLWWGLVAANNRSPSIGAINGEAEFGARSLFGYGDPLTLSAGGSEGTLHATGTYEAPIAGTDWSVRLAGEYAKASVIEAPLSAIDVESTSWSAEAGLRYRILHRLGLDVTAGATLARRHSTTYLLGEPFSFTAGVDDGNSDVTVLRLPVEAVWRGHRHVLAARSTLSVGLPWLGATVHSDAPDSRFVVWLGQTQAAIRTTDSGQQVLARLDVQLANDALLPLEQIGVGGMATVRGYYENQLVRDDALVMSLEYRFPVAEWRWPALDGGRPEDGRLYLSPFVDAARSWSVTDGQVDWLASSGVALSWSPGPRLSADLAYGYRLIPISNPQSSDPLQGNGVHFRLRWRF